MLNVLKAIIWITVGCALFIFLFWRLWFLRDPHREIPTGNVIVSPADGRILEIRKINLPGVEKKGKGMFNFTGNGLENPSLMVSIFMSPLNVHVNRAPIPGRVLSVTHRPGSFLPADSEAASNNESNEIIIKGDQVSVGVVQVAGMLARRIECFVKVGDTVDRGKRIGLINLGSRVCLLLPPNIKPKVSVGDFVEAGSTIIADLEEK